MQGTRYRGPMLASELAVTDVEVAETVAIFCFGRFSAIGGIMLLLIAVPAGDLGEVLLASILSPILARLLLFTDNDIQLCSLRVAFQAGFFPFSLLFLPLLFPIFPDLIWGLRLVRFRGVCLGRRGRGLWFLGLIVLRIEAHFQWSLVFGAPLI